MLISGNEGAHQRGSGRPYESNFKCHIIDILSIKKQVKPHISFCFHNHLICMTFHNPHAESNHYKHRTVKFKDSQPHSSKQENFVMHKISK